MRWSEGGVVGSWYLVIGAETRPAAARFDVSDALDRVPDAQRPTTNYQLPGDCAEYT
jgi:hypothetical protein